MSYHKERDSRERSRSFDRQNKETKDDDKRNQVFIAKLSSEVRERDLDDKFRKYGDIKHIKLKTGFAFVEFERYKDAEDAIERMNGREFFGKRIVVEHTKGKKTERRDRPRRYSRDSRDRDYRDRRDSRDRYKRNSRDRRDSRDRGDYKERRFVRRDDGNSSRDNKCFNCNEFGHKKFDCPNKRQFR